MANYSCLYQFKVRLASKKTLLKEENQNYSEEGLDSVAVPTNKESLNM